MTKRIGIAAGCLVTLAVVVALVLCLPAGRTATSSSRPPSASSRLASSRNQESAAPPADLPAAAPPAELHGMWVTYFELAGFYDSPKGFQAGYDAMLERCAAEGVNALFVHVRSHCDAFYPSEIFPWSGYATGIKGTQGTDPGYDPLAYMIDATHKKGMEFHAWINPYRVDAFSTDIDPLDEKNPARRWLTDNDPSNDTWVREAAGGLYLNPAVQEVQALIANGVREIVTRYPVDGIHFDDYFYPTTDESFDEAEYVAYRTGVWDNPLPLGEWRCANVNAMVSAVSHVVRAARPACRFGISPMSSVISNRLAYYADVAAWVRDGYLDYLMPQLYFGFEYPKETARFDRLLADWLAVTDGSDTALYIGLGAYRIGATDEDNIEWSEHHDILARELHCLREAGCPGFCLYSYSAYFTDDEAHQAERAALLEELRS